MRILKHKQRVEALMIGGMGLLLWGTIRVVFDETWLGSLVLALPAWFMGSAIAIRLRDVLEMVRTPVPLAKAGRGELRVKLARLKQVVVKLPTDLQEVVNALTTRAVKLVNQIDADIVQDSEALKWTTQQEQLRQVFEELLPPLLNAFIKVSAAGAVEEGEAVPSKERVFLEEQLKAIGGRLTVFEGEHLRYQEECFRTHKEALAAYLERTGPAAKELKAEEGQLLGLSPGVAMVSGSASCYDNAVVVAYGGFRQEFAGRSRDVEVGMSALRADWKAPMEEEEDQGENEIGVAGTPETPETPETYSMSSEYRMQAEDTKRRYERYEKKRYSRCAES